MSNKYHAAIVKDYNTGETYVQFTDDIDSLSCDAIETHHNEYYAQALNWAQNAAFNKALELSCDVELYDHTISDNKPVATYHGGL